MEFIVELLNLIEIDFLMDLLEFIIDQLGRRIKQPDVGAISENITSGSFAMKTIIKPIDPPGYDIDVATINI